MLSHRKLGFDLRHGLLLLDKLELAGPWICILSVSLHICQILPSSKPKISTLSQSSFPTGGKLLTLQNTDYICCLPSRTPRSHFITQILFPIFCFLPLGMVSSLPSLPSWHSHSCSPLLVLVPPHFSTCPNFEVDLPKLSS